MVAVTKMRHDEETGAYVKNDNSNTKPTEKSTANSNVTPPAEFTGTSTKQLTQQKVLTSIEAPNE